jgi:hypothetical protein
MAKSGDPEQLGSDAAQAIGPLMKKAETAFKTASLVAKKSNPKLVESLADQVEDLISDANGMKGLLKELQAAS